MPPGERLALARATYLRAITLARARSTPATWARVLAAAKNLDGAKRDAERRRRPGRAPIPGERGSSSGASVSSRSSVFVLTGSREWDPSDVREPDRATPRRSRLERWPEVAAEWERGRALRAQSRRLVEEAYALWAEIARLSAQTQMPSTRA